MEAASTTGNNQNTSRSKGKKRRQPDTDIDETKRIKKEIPTRPGPLQTILMPAKGKSTKDLIEASNANLDKFQWSIQKNHTGKTPNGMTKYSRFYFKFLMRESCDSKSCGYHLCLNAPMVDNVPVKEWSSFRSWVLNLSSFIRFTPEAPKTKQFNPNEDD